MPKASRSPLRRLAPVRGWLFALALALAAAHSVAIWHGYRHADDSVALAGKKHSASDACSVCVAVAGIGAGLPAQPAWQLQCFAQAAPDPAPAEATQVAPPRSPYAIRAPPLRWA